MRDRKNITVSLSGKISTVDVCAEMTVSDSPRVYLENEPISSSIHEEMGELQKSQRKFQKCKEITKITNTGVFETFSSKLISLDRIFPVC